MVKLNPVLYRDKCTCTSAIEWFNFLSYKRLSCVLQLNTLALVVINVLALQCYRYHRTTCTNDALFWLDSLMLQVQLMQYVTM